ncbi:MAG: hypothetical protein COA84_13785 [Robiginitomaculum sp.]|nr:MAG: hypothetical protein COA84_13785 [Robiginitomaculum sp.]
MIFSEDQVKDIISLLEVSSPETKIYFGCDSIRFRKNKRRYAKFATVCIVHKDGRSGCRIFASKSVEPDYDVKKNRPKMRMMNEVTKVVEAYKQLIPYIEGLSEIYEDKNGKIQIKDFDIEIHLDISTDPKHGSNCAAKEAAGYVLAYTGVEAKLKPDAFAASFGGDHVVNHS